MMKKISVLLLCATSLSLATCIPAGPNSDAAITADASQFATQTAQSTLTLPAPTSTQPALTGTPAPTSLNQAGPYVLYASNEGIWVSNPNGSFTIKLTDLGVEGIIDLHRLISPKGDRLAWIARNDEGFDLVEVKIPSGETKIITRLLSITQDELVSHPTSEKAIASYAIYDYDNIAWQPGEGRLLAFMGAMNGPTSDLYTYDTQTGEITQLTSGLTQGVFPNWSPDGKYILHYGVSWKGPYGGAILGHNRLNGVFAARVADGEIIDLPTPKSISLNFVGWQDDTHYITYDSDETCGSQNLRSVDVVTGEATPIMDLSFNSYIARSPENGALLFSGAKGCANSVGEGVFLLLPGQTTPTRLGFQSALGVDWLPESKVFHAYPVALFSSDGNTHYNVPVRDKSFTPAISQKGYQAWKVIENFEGRVEVKVPGAGWRKIFDGSVANLIWDPVSGETLLITREDGGVFAASYPHFVPRPVGHVGHSTQVIWVP